MAALSDGSPRTPSTLCMELGTCSSSAAVGSAIGLTLTLSQVWSVVALPDGSGCVSCSADHDVKFWEWQVAAAAPGGGARQLGMRHTRTLKMADDVLCCRVSADGRLLAVALLDSTIQARALPGRAPTDTHPDSDRRSEKAEDIMGRALTRSWKALRCARRELQRGTGSRRARARARRSSSWTA
jgi:hypothetical protein